MTQVIHWIAFTLLCAWPCFAFYSSNHHHHPQRSISFLSATPLTEDTATSTSSFEPIQANFSCDFCQAKFTSRNAIFRHLRADGCTIDNPRQPSECNDDPIVKQSIAILFGYVSNHDETTAIALNDWAGEQVLQAVQETIDKFNPEQHKPLDFRLQESRTQSSVARLRSRVVQQEPDCHAARDVLVLTGTCLQSSLPDLEQALSKLPTTVSTPLSSASVRIWSCKLLNSEIRQASIHAERSCTQMVYQYLVPIAWLPDAHLLQNHWQGWKEKPPTDCLQRLKAALRRVESKMASGDDPKNSKVAAGRFGRLGAKERRAFHNFADPSLRGKASPNQEPVWRVVDACRIIGIVNFGKEDAAVVVEIKGDAFVPQQVRRLVGTALAMVHGWIPESAWETFLNPDCLLETILAPPGRLALADCRFHFEESRTSGIPIFETDICGKVLGIGDGNGKRASAWAAKEMLKRLSSSQTRKAEQEWLEDVRDTIAPRIRDSILSLHSPSPTKLLQEGDSSPAPKEYHSVLQHLRDIVSAGKWPDTSVARSTVIRGSENNGKAGSFTVVNTKVLEQQMKSESKEEIPLPLGNQLFPDLVQAVFDLEEAISAHARKVEMASTEGAPVVSSDFTTRRPQSSHCAINAMAQFTPHVDSGRGAGQSLSIIVGLGDYCNGELFVEGLPVDIRYKPLEFDGWALRHWTNQYSGEIFSLVWFSPEQKG